MEQRTFSQREQEEMQAASARVAAQLEEIDVELAKAAPSVWYTAGLCREYYDALKETFRDEENQMSLLTNDQIIRILVDTIGQIKR